MWLVPNTLDVTSLYEKLTQVVLMYHPAYIILRVNLDAPSWWAELHPLELVSDAGEVRRVQSLSSLVWRHEVSRKLRRLMESIADGPFASHVIGYQLRFTTPWSPGAAMPRIDYSVPARKGFQRWLHGRYCTDQALQEAWHEPSITRESAQLPLVEGDAPGSEEQVRDAYRYHAWIVADVHASIARFMKRVCDGGTLVGVTCPVESLSAVDEALMYWDKLLLASDDVDFLLVRACGSDEAVPQAYRDIEQLCSIRGKAWFVERQLDSTGVVA